MIDMSAKEKQSVTSIEDACILTQLTTERLGVVLSEIKQSFFDSYNPESPEGKTCIAYEFPRMAIFMDIALELLLELPKVAEFLSSQA